MIPPPVRGRNVSIEQAIQQVPELKKTMEENDQVRDLIDLARRLEGCARHVSVHAAGVVITPEPLQELIPIAVSAKDEVTTQYEMSDLEKVNPELRKMVQSLTNNGVSPIIRTPEGYRILRVITKEPAGQRDLSDPRVQQNIRSQLHDRREQLLKAAYYEVLRDSAKVENYYAKKVLDSNGLAK